MFVRFVAGALGIYEAVERDCPRSDLRRIGKPDGSWLPRVGAKYPDAVSFWTERGLERYLKSGLCDWHRSVVSSPISVLVTPAIERRFYQDEFQIICPAEQSVRRHEWEEFARSLSRRRS